MTCEREHRATRPPVPAVIKGSHGRHVRRREPLYRGPTALLINTAGTSLLGMAFWVVAARRYSPEIVGASSAVISVMLLLATLAELNLTSAVVRFLPTAGPRRQSFIIRSYATVACLGALIGASALPLLRHLTVIRRLLALGPAGALWFAVAVGIWCLFALQDAVAIALRGSRWVVAENSAFGVMKLAALVGLATAAPSLGIFASWTIPMLLTIPAMNVIIFGSLLPAQERIGGLTETVSWRHLRDFITFEYFTGLVNVAATTFIQILVLVRLGATDNAYFYVVWVTTSAIDLALMNVGSSLVAEAARQPERLASLTRALSRHLVKLLAPIVAVLIIGAPLFLRILGAAYSSHSTTLLRLLALAVAPRIVITLWMSIHRVHRKVGRILALQATLAAVTVGASAIALDIHHSITVIGLIYLTTQGVVALGVLPSLLSYTRPHRSQTGRMTRRAGGNPAAPLP
jgi:O-antigen/teichoic acid export membrane protein